MKLKSKLLGQSALMAIALCLAGCAGTDQTISTDASKAGATVPAVSTATVDLLDIVPAIVTDVSNLISAGKSIFSTPTPVKAGS